MKKNFFWDEVSEVIIGDPVNIREDILKLWLDGLTEDEANSRLITPSVKDNTTWLNEEEYIRGDIRDSYRVFNRIQYSIINNSWMLVELSTNQRQLICEKYFALENILTLNILITDFNLKKLESKNIYNKNVLNRYENNILLLEDTFANTESGDKVEVIMKRANISRELAMKYLVLMFIRYHKISFKRKYKNNYTMPFIYVCVQKRAKLNRISLYEKMSLVDALEKLKSFELDPDYIKESASLQKQNPSITKLFGMTLSHSTNDTSKINATDRYRRIIFLYIFWINKTSVTYNLDDIDTYLGRYMYRWKVEDIYAYFGDVYAECLTKCNCNKNSIKQFIGFLENFVLEYKKEKML